MDEMEAGPSGCCRRTPTMRSNAARQVAVNFMPSKQLPYNTLKLRRSCSEHEALVEAAAEVIGDGQPSSEKQADIIVREMEQHQPLMENNPFAEEMRREALRDLPRGLTMKRHVRAKLSVSVSMRSKQKPITWFKSLKYRLSYTFKRAKDYLKNFIFSIELWYEPIRKVESHFGSAVGSYFYFLRWLFVMNLLLSIFVTLFVVIPQALHDAAQNVTEGHSRGTGFLDGITGKGVLEDTLLFYGHYHSGLISTGGSIKYDMTFSYFFTMLFLYGVLFIVLCYKTAHSYRRNFIETSGGLSNAFASKILCGWDHSVAAPEAAQLQAKIIYIDLKELLNELKKDNRQMSFWTLAWQYSSNVFINALVLAFIFGLELGFWVVLQLRVEAMETLRSSEYWAVIVSTIVTVVVTLCPVMFAYVVKLEYYKPRTALYVTLLRTFLLDISTLILVVTFWSQSNFECWETAVGQETYRLILYGAIVSIVFIPTIDVIRGVIFKKCPMRDSPEFNIAYNSLTLIYNQIIVFLGMLFSPTLVLVVTLKFLFYFYVKKECALRFCRPARKVWRAAQTQTVLYMLINLSLFVALFALGSLFVQTSAHKCGPFSEYKYVYSVLTEGLLGLTGHSQLKAGLLFMLRPGVIAFLLLFLGVGVYYMRARSLAHQSMVLILRHMLLLSAKDKEFLLTAIEKVSNGEWMYNPKIEIPLEPNDSHTWKYLHDEKIRKPSNSGFHLDSSRNNHSLLDRSKRRSLSHRERPLSNTYEMKERGEDGDTDSSFSWQGSNRQLNESV